MRRCRTTIVLFLALTTLLFISICSAQQTIPTICYPVTSSTGSPPNVIPMWGTVCDLVNSVISQSGAFVGVNNSSPSVALDVNGQISTDTWYDINERRIVSVHTGVPTSAANNSLNLFLGWLAGGNPGQFNGTFNTFTGYSAGFNNNQPALKGANTYNGTYAGFANVTGFYNTMVGANSGFRNTSSQNTCVGFSACSEHKTGEGITYVGSQAGIRDLTAKSNSFFGHRAGWNVIAGSFNTYLGDMAGSSSYSVNGSNNVFVGAGAGSAETNDVSNNIEIGNTGPAPNGSNSILIGTQGTQTATYIAGIFPTGVANTNPVCVLATGQLGVCSSSRRFKENIRDMGDSSSNLMKLRPVTYLYKPEYDKGPRSLQYGLIAEEVAEVYPDLIAYEPDGKPLTVNYQNLSAMLLNELQKQHTVVAAQQDELQTQLQQIKVQRQEIDGLKLQLQQQNASLQERLTKLESYVATQTKTASDNPPPMTATANGGVQ